MFREKGVFNLAKRRVSFGETEIYMGRIAICLYLYIEEQAKPQGHAQK